MNLGQLILVGGLVGYVWILCGIATAAGMEDHGESGERQTAAFLFWPLFWLKIVLQFLWKAIKGLSYLKEGW